MRRAIALLALSCALLAAGCGEDQPDSGAAGTATTQEPAALSGAERRSFDRAVAQIQRHCRTWARRITAGKPLTGEQSERAAGAVDTLLELARTKPRAPIGTAADVRLRVGDIAESVEGANCDPLLLERLETGLAAAVAGGG